MTATSSPNAVFQGLLSQMQQYSAGIAAYMQGGTVPRRWMLPPVSEDGWQGLVRDPETIGQAFDRSEANEAYKDTLHNGASAACAAHNTEIVYVGMLERSFRSRHTSVCRAMAAAAGRRNGHGDPGGIHLGQVLQYVQNILSGSSANE